MGLLRRERLRRAGLLIVLVACTVAGAWSGPRLIGPGTYSTTVADVRLQVSVARPSNRGLDLYVPLADWGLRVPLVDAPVRVRVEPRRINRGGVVRLVTQGGQDSVSDLRSQLDDALESAAVRFASATLAGALAGGLLTLLLWQAAGVRGRRSLVAAPLSAFVASLAVVGGLAWWSSASFDASRLERPAYYASGIELERILAQASSLRQSGEKYSDRVDNAVRAITGLLDDRGTGPSLVPEQLEPTERIVLASDLHNNLLTLPTLRRYAEGNLTVLAGDFTINGGRIEVPLAERAAAVGDPVVAVSGNHDSPGIMNALRRRGVIVLDHEAGVQVVDGVAMAGFEDPLMFGGREFPLGLRAGISFGNLPDGHRLFVDAVRQRWDWWLALPTRPSVLVVHQAAIGRALANLIWQQDPEAAPLTILVGHTHRQRLDRYGPVTLVDSGSIGAGGLFGIGSQDVGLAMLNLREGNALDTVDLVSQNPSTSAARARRVVIDTPDCDDTLVFCHTEPDVLPELDPAVP